MWQTFTPNCSNIIAVEIDILTVSPGQGDDVLTVEIARDGETLAWLMSAYPAQAISSVA